MNPIKPEIESAGKAVTALLIPIEPDSINASSSAAVDESARRRCVDALCFLWERTSFPVDQIVAEAWNKETVLECALFTFENILKYCAEVEVQGAEVSK